MTVYDVCVYFRGKRRTVNRRHYQSFALAELMANAEAQRVPIPGVVEIWSIKPDGTTLLIRSIPGKV